MCKSIFTLFIVFFTWFTHQASAADIFLELNPQLFFVGGAGGAIGAEFSHIKIGIYGASTPLPESFRDSFFVNAKNANIKNTLAEIGFHVYLKPENQGPYAGFLYGPEWFEVKSKTTSSLQTIRADFIAGRLGYRYFISKKFYVDGAFGYGTKVNGDSAAEIDGTIINLNSNATLIFFSTGIRF